MLAIGSRTFGCVGVGVGVGRLTAVYTSSDADLVTDQQRDHAPAPRSSNEPLSREGRNARIADLQVRYGQPRVRVVDDHMFAVGRRAWYPATFRLQLYTAPGARPVAVVVQSTGEGMGLPNGRERYLSEIWRRHCPDQPEPPLWVQHQLLPDWDELTLVDCRPGDEPHTVATEHARHYRITLDELSALVGAEVDPERGSGFVPRPPQPAEQIRFTVVLVGLLPRPEPFRKPACMPAGTPPARRLARQLAPRRRGGSCCWYHQGDWHKVSRTAIRLLRRADRDGVDHEELRGYFTEQAPRHQLTDWEYEALLSLGCSGDAIQLERDGLDRWYINGQHRAQAILDAGVHRTIAAHWIYPELAKHPDWPYNATTADEGDPLLG